MGRCTILTYKGLRMGALLLLVILFFVLSNAVREDDAVPVMARDDTLYTMEAFIKSLSTLGTIEYKQYIKGGVSTENKGTVEIHYYYKKPGYLRVDTKNKDSVSVDIYTPDGMYEYFPESQTAYFREKWKDESIITFQLDDKLEDIKVRGKYEFLKNERLSDMECEVIRSVDEDQGNIYEHRIWMTLKNNLKLPVREEYLTDGEINMVCEYEYISVNRELSNSLFDIKSMGDIKIYTAEGIPKNVKGEAEAEKYVKFNVRVPKYVPEGFKINEMCAIPPVKNPTVLISYINNGETIQFRQKNIKVNKLEISDSESTIQAGERKFAIGRQDDCVTVRWVKDGIEFEFNGPYTLKDEIVKMVESVSGIWITID